MNITIWITTSLPSKNKNSNFCNFNMESSFSDKVILLVPPVRPYIVRVLTVSVNLVLLFFVRFSKPLRRVFPYFFLFCFRYKLSNTNKKKPQPPIDITNINIYSIFIYVHFKLNFLKAKYIIIKKL